VTAVRAGRAAPAAAAPAAAPVQNQSSICHGPLATHVDQFIVHSSFVPFRVPQGHFRPHEKEKPGQVQTHDSSLFAKAVRLATAEELDEHTKALTFADFKRQTHIRLGVRSPVASAALRSSILDAKRRAAVLRQHYDQYIADERQRVREQLKHHSDSVLTAPSAGEALRRLGRRFVTTHRMFRRQGNRPAGTRQTRDGLAVFTSLGFLFLERLRIRPIGHTLERAPFYTLSLTPGESVTLRQQSFSKRTSTFEQTQEEEEERKSEYSSTFTTELAQEYTHAIQDSTNWGISQSVTGTYEAQTWNISGTTAGNYGATTSETDSVTEISRNVEQTLRKVETRQKTTHKTVVTIGHEDTLQQESLRVLRNDEDRTKKVYMRRVMQVLHLSYERYGVRLCWAPCVQDPGRDVRQIVPAEGGFAEEIDAIRRRWADTPPPAELGAPPTPSRRGRPLQ
jgi:hypothetical protein